MQLLWGGGGADLRLLELMLYNISLPLCFDFKTFVSYLCTHDKKLKYKNIKEFVRYISRNKYDKFFYHISNQYQYRLYEDPCGDNILTMFLNNNLHPHAYPYGYFQNLAYFQEIDSIIRQEFSLKTPLQHHNQILKQKIASCSNSVFLHIRLGDYIKNDVTGGTYVYLAKTYYQQAINLMKEILNGPNIFIFSNDIEWCEQNLCNFLDFKDCNIEFVKGNGEGNAAEEMELMKTCKHAIIANSTFSWWAAYLIDNKDKQIITPTQVFNDARKIPYMNMLTQKGWIMVDPFWGTHTVV